MQSVREKSKAYNPNWVCFNQAISQNGNGHEHMKPNVLVVADEIFMMSDSQLQQKARSVVPSTFRDRQNPIQDKHERQKSKEAWQNNMFCVQVHCFNSSFEIQDITVYDYLLSFSHEIISFKNMFRHHGASD